MYVGRPTKWGNPYRVGDGLCNSLVEVINYYELWLIEGTDYTSDEPHAPPNEDEIKSELRGKDLACWCAPGAPCHADVLLRIANDESS